MDIEMPARFRYPKGKTSDYTHLDFPGWPKIFHVHVDASFIALGVILAQLGEGSIDHPIYFPS
jgi:hypothetical protein